MLYGRSQAPAKSIYGYSAVADGFFQQGRAAFVGREYEMKVIRIGIAPQQRIRERVLAIAKGEVKPMASDPKVWFTSMRSFSQVLSDENRALLDAIRTAEPTSHQ